ncbi:MAG TPA: chemotaxis response regulator protein-glutamate methylesterase [Acidimicrobiales bacterium]|nr:chemotaxis response regulator protein-glutamate methylesterase [Acidimicrobiales bacterium]
MNPPFPPPPVEAVRVVLVDDSAVVRLALSAVINRQADMVLAGTAKNGREAVEVVEQTDPDVVVLDMEMPVLDGLGALKILKKNRPKLPVIMFSTLTGRGTEATVEALATGADDYLTKPSTMSGPERGFDAVVTRLLPLLRTWGSISHQRRGASSGPAPAGAANSPAGPECDVASGLATMPDHQPASRAAAPAGDVTSRVGQARAATAAARSATAASRGAARPFPAESTFPVESNNPIALRRSGATHPVSAVVIGSSTGGPNALCAVIPKLPADLGVPVLVVQHMPTTFTRLLAERLDRASALRVQEAPDRTPVRAGNVYLAAGGYHMVVTRTGADVIACLDDGPPENSCKPAVDVLMRSAVQVWQAGVLAVVLTGMGQDGLLGAQAVIGAGGTVIVQDEPTSVVWGMPGAVARAGIASEILALDDVAAAITRRVKPSRPSWAPGRGSHAPSTSLSKVAFL